MLKLHVVAVSTRPSRAGFPVAKWFEERAKAHGKFEATLVDLRELNLPLFDEPHHPRLKKYEHDHTRRWSAIVEAADAFVFVTPEYNYTAPPSFTNAVDYLVHEWAYKPAAFVSYGGFAGGARAVQVEKTHLTSMKVMPIPETVLIPMFMQHLEKDVFKSTEALDKSAILVLDELQKWSTALSRCGPRESNVHPISAADVKRARLRLVADARPIRETGTLAPRFRKL